MDYTEEDINKETYEHNPFTILHKLSFDVDLFEYVFPAYLFPLSPFCLYARIDLIKPLQKPFNPPLISQELKVKLTIHRINFPTMSIDGNKDRYDQTFTGVAINTRK